MLIQCLVQRYSFRIFSRDGTGPLSMPMLLIPSVHVDLVNFAVTGEHLAQILLKAIGPGISPEDVHGTAIDQIYPADSRCAAGLYARYFRCVAMWSARNLASCQTPQMKEDPRRDCHGNPRK